jgi:hypothetical protein
MIAINKGAGEELRLSLEQGETQVLQQLIDELLELLLTEEADDRVSRRLFPDAYDSAEDTAAYNQLVFDQLRRDKIGSLQQMRSDLGRGGTEVTLSRESSEKWLTALTDLRLALGTRLEMTEQKMAADLDPQDPEAPWLAALHWLGWVQESMLEALNPL